MYVPNEIEKILFTKEQLDDCVRRLGEQLTEDYSDKNPLFLCVLKGASLFFADLVRAVECPMEFDFVRTSSYVGTNSCGEVKVEMMKTPNILGRDVVVVEDICDSGRSLCAISKALSEMQPKSVKVVTLLNKPSKRVVDFKPDYIGYEIDDYFVVGNGFDVDERFRNLPYVGMLRQHCTKTG